MIRYYFEFTNILSECQDLFIYIYSIKAHCLSRIEEQSYEDKQISNPAFNRLSFLFQ